MLIHHYSQSNGEYLSSGQPTPIRATPNAGSCRHGRRSTPPARTPTTFLPRQRVDAAAGLPRPPLLSHRHGRTGRNRDCRQDARRTRPHDRTATVAAPRMDQRRVGHPGRAARARERDAAMAEFERRLEAARKANAGKADAYAAGLLDDEGVYHFRPGLPDGTRFGRPGRHVPDAVTWPTTPAPYVPPPPPQPEPQPQPQPEPESKPQPDEPSAPAAPVADPRPDPHGISPALSSDLHTQEPHTMPQDYHHGVRVIESARRSAPCRRPSSASSAPRPTPMPPPSRSTRPSC